MSQVRDRLIGLGVEIRPRGNRLGTPHANRKLTTKLITQIIEWDNQNINHPEIARQLKKFYNVEITRERIRQVCLNAGQPTRISRLVPKVDAIRSKIAARKIVRDKLLMDASKLWKAGAGCADMCEALRGYRNYSVGASLVSMYRRRYPKLFPYRRLPTMKRTF
jgi:hypothetical protein